MDINNIIKNYEKFIKSKILLYSKDDFVLKEVYQKILIKLWTNQPKIVTSKYLSKLVKFAFIDNYRRNKKHLYHEKIDCVNLDSDYNADYLLNLKENIIESNILIKDLFLDIENLKKNQKDVVFLRLYGLSFYKIGKVLNTSQNNAISQFYYAKKNLNKKRQND